MFALSYFFQLNAIKFAYFVRLVLFVVGFALALVGCGNSEPSMFQSTPESILKGRTAAIKGVCSLDSVARKNVTEGVYRAKAGSEEALFSGWAWEKVRNVPSDYVAVRLTNALTGLPTYAYTSTRAMRPDVATVIQISPDAKVAFELNAKKLPLQSGLYRVELLQVWANEIAICNVPGMLLLE